MDDEALTINGETKPRPTTQQEYLGALREALAALAGCGEDDMARAAHSFAKRALLFAEEAGMPERSLERLRAVEMPQDARG